MREARKAPSSPPKAAPRPHAPAPPSHAPTPVQAEAQAVAASQSFARTGSVAWAGGAPAATGVVLQRDAAVPGSNESVVFGVVIDDGLPLGEGQIHRTDFVEMIAAELFRVADEELAAVNRTAADCPFLAHWHAYFLTKPAVLIERTIRLYAEPERTDLDGLKDALIRKARESAQRWVMLGTPGHDSGLLFPPGVVAPPPAEGGEESLARKADSAVDGPAPAGSARAVQARLGSGQPLESGVRARMERGFRTSFSDVRVHTGPEAARISTQYSARAFAVGSDVGFAPGRFRPGSLAGDALIAHELAHVVQQRGSAYDAGASRSPLLEQDADRAAAGLLTGAEMPSPRGRTGTRLQFDICDEDPAAIDWHDENSFAYAIATGELRNLRDEQQRLMAQPGMDPARAARLAEIDRRMTEMARSIQAMGVQRTTSEILSAVLAGEDLRQVTVAEFLGDTPRTLYWGEQREFRIRLGYHPDREVKIGWWVSFGGEERPLGITDYRKGEDKVKLEGEFWTAFGTFAQRENAASGHASEPGFSILADVVIAGEVPPARTHVTNWLRVEHRVPSDVSIMVPHIDQRPPAAPAAATPPTSAAPAATSPGGAPSGGSTPSATSTDLAALAAGPSTAASSGDDVILEGARIHYRLSWLAPMLRGQSPRYAIWWRIYRLDTSGETLVHEFGPGGIWGITGPIAGAGTYEVRATVVNWDRDAIGGGFGTTAVASARRRLRVMTESDVGSRALETYRTSGGPPSYAAFVVDLDRQIASLRATLAGGSMTPRALESQISQLTDMRERLMNQMGSTNAQPFPADGNFVQGTTYAAPLTAVMVHPSHAGAVPMSIYLRVWHDGNWHCRLVDTTTADVVAVEGSASNVPDAILNSINALQSRNEYPQDGHLYYSFTGGGISLTGHFGTSHWTKTFIEWFDKILFVVGTIVGVVLLLTPEPSGLTKAAGVALLTVSLLRSAYAIYSNLRLGRPLLDQRNVLEMLSILSAFLGIRGSQIINRATQAEVMTARAISSFRVGRGMIIASFATDAGSFVYAAHDAMRQLEAAASAGGSDAEREANFNATLMRLAVQGLLLLGNARDVFRPMTGATGPRRSVAAALEAEGRIQLDPAARTRLEADLRGMGFHEDTSRMTDGDLVRQYADLHFAAARLEAQGGAAGAPVGATRGRAQYDASATPHLTGGQVSTAISRPEFRNRPHANATVARASARPGNIVETTMTVRTAGGADVTCNVQIHLVDDITALPSPHGAEGGWARVTVLKNADGSWSANVAVDRRLSLPGDSAVDIRNVLGHELDEAAIIIRRAEADPTLNLALQHEASVFRTGGDPRAARTGHDVATVHELRRIFNEVGGWVEQFRIASQDLANHGTPIPPAVQRIQERVNSMLDTMGFRDPAGREARILALQAELGANMPPGLADYIRGRYGQRVAAEVRIEAALGNAPGAINVDLVIHLIHAEPTGSANFGAQGLYGGHDQNALYAMVDSSTMTTTGGNTRQRYQVSIAKETTLAGMTTRVHIQYERGANITIDVPPRDVRASTAAAANFDAARAAAPGQLGWTQSSAPKTTVDRMDIFLREVNQGFTAWAGSPAAAAITGNEVVFGAVPGATAPAIVTANGVALGGRAVRVGGAWQITRVWMELSNFGW